MYENARKVFQVFCSFLEAKKGALNWFCQFEDIEKATGLEYGDIDAALQILTRKGLVSREADDMWQMTDVGADAYDVPANLDELLPVRQ